jgi:hypothetical protein
MEPASTVAASTVAASAVATAARGLNPALANDQEQNRQENSDSLGCGFHATLRPDSEHDRSIRTLFDVGLLPVEAPYTDRLTFSRPSKRPLVETCIHRPLPCLSTPYLNVPFSGSNSLIH